MPRQIKHRGPLTNKETAIIEAVVADSQEPITEGKVHGLSVTLQRRKETIRRAVERAREHLAEQADHYVTVHKQVVDEALAEGTPKGLEQARLGSEWALENLSIEGTRVVDKGSKDASGVQVMIGVQIGGLKE